MLGISSERRDFRRGFTAEIRRNGEAHEVFLTLTATSLQTMCAATIRYDTIRYEHTMMSANLATRDRCDLEARAGLQRGWGSGVRARDSSIRKAARARLLPCVSSAPLCAVCSPARGLSVRPRAAARHALPHSPLSCRRCFSLFFTFLLNSGSRHAQGQPGSRDPVRSVI